MGIRRNILNMESRQIGDLSDMRKMTLPVSFHRKPQKARKFSEIQVHSFMSIERIGKNQPGNDLQEKQIKRQRMLRLPQEDYLSGRTKDRGCCDCLKKTICLEELKIEDVATASRRLFAWKN